MNLEVGPFREKEVRGLIEGPCGALEVICLAPVELAAASWSERVVAVVCHPHPVHGGTMENKVVTTLTRAYRDLGVPVVTFNFRGVGRSEGRYDEGVGEVDDVLAVVRWVKGCYPGRSLLLAGFSFGSAMAAAASHRLHDDLSHLLLVAPPVERYRYDIEGRFPCPVAVIIGDQDELVDVVEVQNWEKELQSSSALMLYPQTGHFFHGRLAELKQDVTELLTKECGQ